MPSNFRSHRLIESPSERNESRGSAFANTFPMTTWLLTGHTLLCERRSCLAQFLSGDLRLSCSFVNDTVLHDDCEVFTGIADQVDIG
jgi:hypothetical protein